MKEGVAVGVLADKIERQILQKFMNENEVIVQRKKLALELDCAPSQISYVLSTRFSCERGFIVESKRGLGGYVRIAFITSKLETDDNIDENPSIDHINAKLHANLKDGLITKREAQIIYEAFRIIFAYPEGEQQRFFVRQLTARINALL